MFPMATRFVISAVFSPNDNTSTFNTEKILHINIKKNKNLERIQNTQKKTKA